MANTAASIIYFGVLAYSAYTDLRYGLVKNYAVVVLLVSGLVFSSGLTELIAGIFQHNVDIIPLIQNFLTNMALFLALCVFGFFVLTKIMAPGDVKLVIGIGAVIGTVSVLDVILFALLGAIIVFFLTNAQKVWLVLKRVYYMLSNFAITRQFDEINPENSYHVIPFAVYLFAGAIVSKLLGEQILISGIITLWR